MRKIFVARTLADTMTSLFFVAAERKYFLVLKPTWAEATGLAKKPGTPILQKLDQHIYVKNVFLYEPCQ